MVVDFLSFPGQSQIGNLYFTTDYEAEKKAKMMGRAGSSGYMGPNFDQLPEGLEEGIAELLEKLGVN